MKQKKDLGFSNKKLYPKSQLQIANLVTLRENFGGFLSEKSSLSGAWSGRVIQY